MGVINLLNNKLISQRSKHIDVKYHFIRENVKKGKIKLKHLSTNEMIVDIFTKPLAKGKFDFFKKLRLY